MSVRPRRKVGYSIEVAEELWVEAGPHVVTFVQREIERKFATEGLWLDPQLFELRAERVAHPPYAESWTERLRRWLRRHPRLQERRTIRVMGVGWSG